MKRYLFSLLLALIILITPCFAQNDQIVNARNVYIQMTNAVPWSTLAAQTYILTPQTPDYGFCVSIVNNNPTSAHTFTVSAFQSGDSNVVDYSHNTGRYASLALVGLPSPVPAATTNTFFVRSNGAAKIAFVFAGASTQAGSPDTVDIFAVQTTAVGCGTVNPQTGQLYTLATPNSGTSSATPIMAVSDGLSQAFSSNIALTNPGANLEVLSVINQGTKNIYFDKLILSASAIANANVYTVTNVGTTCSTPGSINLKISSGVTSTTTTTSQCGVGSSRILLIDTIALNASSATIIDLKGIIAVAGQTTGLQIVNSTALTGRFSATLMWYEK
jgi:hypothetical protein